jgi:uncharacterized protein YukE
MARVCGDSQSAYGLAKGLDTAKQAIESALDECDKAVNQIKGAWNDDGNQVIEELISSVRTAMNNASENIPNLKKAVDNYAQFLESRGK